MLFIVNHHSPSLFFFFFFNDTATTEIYTLSLHDALPISREQGIAYIRDHTRVPRLRAAVPVDRYPIWPAQGLSYARSEEHTSELQSLAYLVCRLLLEKKKKKLQNRRAGLEQSV